MKYCILALFLILSLGLHAQSGAQPGAQPGKYADLVKKYAALVKANNYPGAFTLVNDALTTDSTSGQLYLMRGFLHKDLDQFPDAIKDFQAAFHHVDSDTLRGEALELIAETKSDMGGDPEADFRAALALNSNDANALTNLSIYLWRAKKGGEECITLMEKVMRLDSGKKENYLNLAFMNGEFGHYQKALDISNAELDRFGESPRILNNRGYIKYKLGDLDGALTDINQSIAWEPTNSYAYRNRALVLLAQQKDACPDLQKAQTLGYEKDWGNDVKDLLAQHCAR